MTLFDSLWKFLLVSSPYLIIGLFFSGVIHTFISIDKLKSLVGKNKISDIFWAALIGVPLPLCSCSVIPTAVTLRKAGASTGATSAFLIATPESGVDSIIMTYAMMDLPMTIMRPLAAFISAFVAGILNFKFNSVFHFSETDHSHHNHAHHEHQDDHKSCCAHENKKTIRTKIVEVFNFGFGDLLRDLAFWLLIGIVLGSLIDFFVPENFFAELGGWQSRLVILLIGIPLYICASASTPVAASLMLKGLSPGSALILLLVGPATNISNILVLQKYIGKKGMIINLVSIAFVALIFSFVADFLYANYFPVKINSSLMSHEHAEGSWWQVASVVIFLPLLLRAFYQEEIAPRMKKKEKESCCH
jgi:uncharacterized membrane protein YraQ (UPF0718 family)